MNTKEMIAAYNALLETLLPLTRNQNPEIQNQATIQMSRCMRSIRELESKNNPFIA